MSTILAILTIAMWLGTAYCVVLILRLAWATFRLRRVLRKHPEWTVAEAADHIVRGTA